MSVILPVQVAYTFLVQTASTSPLEANMRVIPPMLAGLALLATIPVHAAPSPKQEDWHRPGALRGIPMGDRTCDQGRHQVLRHDIFGQWWWGPCVADR
jgi:hypothetical protein